MISYFKYTDGTAFTLNGAPYKGMVTVLNETAYTGPIYTSNSKVLSSKQTFLAGAIENSLEFDYSRTTSLQSKISAIEVYPKSILDIDSLTKIAETLNQNNLAIFAAGVGYDQNYGNPLFYTSNTNSFVTGVSSLSSGLISRKVLETTLSLKNNTSLQADAPVTDRSSLFVTLSTDYKYFDKHNTITGDINSQSIPSISNISLIGLKSGTSNIFHDKFKGVLYQTIPSTTVVYNYDYRSPNNVITLADEFDLSQFGVVDDLSKTAYGKTYRTLVGRNSGQIVFEIYKVTSGEIIKSYLIQDLGFDSIERITQRFEDDALAIVGTVGEELVLKLYDADKLRTSTASVYSQPLDITEVPSFISFSPFDSNICLFYYYTSNTLDRVELRSVSGNTTNSPTAVLKSDQFNLFIEQNAINELEDVINLSTLNLYDPTISIFDLSFDVGDDIYSIIYTNNYIKTNNASILKTIVPFNTTSRYSGIATTDSSIGLAINSTLKTIVYDTLTLYYLFNAIRKIDANSIYSETTSNIKNVDASNLLIYSNESINIGVINRVVSEILTLQLDLASKIDSAR